MHRKRIFFFLLPVVFLTAAVLLYTPANSLPGWTSFDELPFGVNRDIRREILAAAKLCQEASPGVHGEPSREALDAMEDALAGKGWSVLNTDKTYPEFLENAAGLEAFHNGEASRQTVIRVREDGGFTHLLFYRAGGQSYFTRTMLRRNAEGELSVDSQEIRPLLDMALTENGYFYYQIYPKDPHYSDYTLIRLSPVDRELYDLAQAYIAPVGYRMVNLFLCDWQEGNWGSLAPGDLFEYLYEVRWGRVLLWAGFSFQYAPFRARIPAALFEDTLLPFFAVSREELRSLCEYDPDEDCYLWRPVYGDDLTAWDYPIFEPRVVSRVQNADGTLTLQVQVAATELKTDCLFSHEVTIRPLQDGGFQYVGNRVTATGEQGLPFSLPRSALD